MTDPVNTPETPPTAMVSMTTSLPDWLADRVHLDMVDGCRNQSGQLRFIIKRYYEMLDEDVPEPYDPSAAFTAARAPFADRYPNEQGTEWQPARPSPVPYVVRDNPQA